MKKIIIVILFVMGFVLNSYSQNSGKAGTFSFTDTSTTYSVSNAKVVYFTVRDSSMTGTDTLHVTIEKVYPNTGIALRSIITLYDLSQTTTTTRIASSLMIAGDNTTKTFAFYPGNVVSDVRFTGTFRIVRTNESTDDAYLPKTRYFFWAED